MQNSFLDAMMFRHACKEFDKSKKISDEVFSSILEIGRLSPSSFGFEPWKFLVIQNESLREKLKEFTWGGQKTLPTASHFMIILARKTQDMIYSSEYIKEMLEARGLTPELKAFYENVYEKFQKQDFTLLESQRALFDWSCKQTYIAMANMMSGAAFMGIDSCPIEGFDRELTQKFLAQDLGIDTDRYDVSVMLAFGYRVNEPRAKVRQDKEKITQWYS